jgi:hypothetical protein
MICNTVHYISYDVLVLASEARASEIIGRAREHSVHFPRCDIGNIDGPTMTSLYHFVSQGNTTREMSWQLLILEKYPLSARNMCPPC